MRNVFTGMEMPEEKELEKARELRDINIKEVSFVSKPASKKTFIFFKGDTEMGNDVIDLLDTIEQIEKSFELSKDENERIETAVAALNKLSSEEVDAISGVLLLLSKVVISKPEVKKSVDGLWPSLSTSEGLLSVSKARAGINVEDTDSDGSKWPSLSSGSDG